MLGATPAKRIICIAPSVRSISKDRVNAIIPAKVKEIHKTLAANLLRSSKSKGKTGPMAKTKARTTIAKIGVVLKDLVVSLLLDTYPQIKKTYLSYGRLKTEIRLNEKD